jgi:hypothetical protein
LAFAEELLHPFVDLLELGEGVDFVGVVFLFFDFDGVELGFEEVFEGADFDVGGGCFE